jgi:putative iron-dependent peroxidase
LSHIRAGALDLCFELASQIMDRLRGAVTVVDEVHGFKYFEVRDLLGFVDGTENPTARAAEEAVTIGAEDPHFAGGSYVIVQKYLHDLMAWNALPVEMQEYGRVELWSSRPTTTVGTRDNMPSAGSSAPTSSGTRAPRASPRKCWRTCSSATPPGNYDRILDFSRAVTGHFFSCRRPTS